MDDESVPVQVRLEVPKGALAQLGERLLCTQEVRGSNPLGSTNIFILLFVKRRRSSAGLECTAHTREVEGSSPPAATIFGPVAQLVRAIGS